MHIIQHFKGLSFLEKATTIINKLDKKTLASSVVNRPIIGLEYVPEAAGLKNLDRIYKAIANKEVLSIDYLPFNKKVPTTYPEIHPFYLKEYRNRWFLFAYSIHPDFDPLIFNFGLERILKIKGTQKPFSDELTFSPIHYFKPIIGVSRPINGVVEEIVLSIKPSQAQYILTKPIHASQKVIIANEKEVIIQLKLMINYELVREIISFMDRVKVITPVSLKKRINGYLVEMINEEENSFEVRKYTA